MIKVMVFIDGSWLYKNQPLLREKIREQHLEIDYGKLPRILADRFGQQLGVSQVDLVRTNFFASIPINISLQDQGYVERQQDFYDRLKEDYHYETEIFHLDFKGNRYLPRDRPGVRFKEKRVDVALASSMLYYAAIPYAYDAAIPIIGDEDFVPVLQHVRRLGKRVMVGSIHGSCNDVYDPARDTTDELRVRDVDTVFLDDIVGELLLEHHLIEIECQDSSHAGNRKIWTRERQRKGQPYYCQDCRTKYARQRSEIEVSLRQDYPEELLAKVQEGYRVGRICKLKLDYGFVRSQDEKEYFFHKRHLPKDVDFSRLTELQPVQFTVQSEQPAPGKNCPDVREILPL